MITDFIKDIIGKKTDVISNGLSSSFILMACHNDDSIIDKVVMIAPPSLTALNKTPTKNTKIIKMLINIPIIGTLVYNILFRKKCIAEQLGKEYYYNSDKLTEDIVDICYESAHANKMMSKYLFSSIKGRYVNVSISHILNSLDNSIFIITGDEKIDELSTSAKQYRKYAPSIEIVHIPKSLFIPHIEQTEDFFKQLQILLEIE